jgi:hypothetical protein
MQLFRFLCGVVLGQIMTLSAIAYVASGSDDLKICGKDQDGPVCVQQWIASIGPAVALFFAAAGTVQIRRQIEQGQHAVTANERSQLRAEYDVLTEIREGFLTRQRDLERLGEEFDSLNGKSWDDLEELQYMLDGLFEYIGDIIREPYLSEVHGKLRAYHRKARRRMELYRASAELWRDGAIDNNKMLKRLVYVQTHCISDSDKLRKLVDSVIGPVGHQIAKLSRKKSRDWQQLLGVSASTSRARKLAIHAEVYRNKKDPHA